MQQTLRNPKNHNGVPYRQTVECLKRLGFDISSIRRCLNILSGISQTDMAKKIDLSRVQVALHIEGSRGNSAVQKTIAGFWGVPVEELFPEKNDQAGVPEEPCSNICVVQ